MVCVGDVWSVVVCMVVCVGDVWSVVFCIVICVGDVWWSVVVCVAGELMVCVWSVVIGLPYNVADCVWFRVVCSVWFGGDVWSLVVHVCWGVDDHFFGCALSVVL